MILAEGKIHPTSEQTHLLDGLEEKINYTLAHSRLSPEVVVNAIDRFGKLIRAGDLDGFIEQSGIGKKKKKDSVKLLCREYLEHKLLTELGEDFFVWHDSQPILGLSGVRTIPVPLGTLFHIAAGNMDALPASTVAEGLLTGNVNILKLPEYQIHMTARCFQQDHSSMLQILLNFHCLQLTAAFHFRKQFLLHHYYCRIKLLSSEL